MPLDHRNPEAVGRGLSLTGGGVRGLFTAAVLREFERRVNRPLRHCFHVISGTSIGGIVAIAIACGISCDEVVNQLRSGAGEIFGSPAGINPWKLRTASYDPDKLAGLVSHVLGDMAQRPIRSLDCNIVISSVDARSNEIVYFSNTERIGTSACLDASLLDVAMATSAAPTFFPPHRIGGKQYLDGGIVSNTPEMEALRFLRNVLSRPLESIQLLSVGTGQTHFDFECSSGWDTGAGAWIAKHRLVDRILSLQECKAVDFVAEVLGTRYLRVDTHFDEKIELDDVRPELLDLLVMRGGKVASEIWGADRSRVSSFLR